MTDIYRHYKGGLYRMLHSEATEKPVVVYQAVDGGRVWTRPKEDFFGTIHGESVAGVTERFLRFSFVGIEER